MIKNVGSKSSFSTASSQGLFLIQPVNFNWRLKTVFQIWAHLHNTSFSPFLCKHITSCLVFVFLLTNGLLDYWSAGLNSLSEGLIHLMADWTVMNCFIRNRINTRFEQRCLNWQLNKEIRPLWNDICVWLNVCMYIAFEDYEMQPSKLAFLLRKKKACRTCLSELLTFCIKYLMVSYIQSSLWLYKKVYLLKI